MSENAKLRIAFIHPDLGIGKRFFLKKKFVRCSLLSRY